MWLNIKLNRSDPFDFISMLSLFLFVSLARVLTNES